MPWEGANGILASLANTSFVSLPPLNNSTFHICFCGTKISFMVKSNLPNGLLQPYPSRLSLSQLSSLGVETETHGEIVAHKWSLVNPDHAYYIDRMLKEMVWVDPSYLELANTVSSL